MPGFFLNLNHPMEIKKAIVFIDGNNLYHNLKEANIKPGYASMKKLAEFICKHFQFNLNKIYYYNSIPDISDGEISYYKQMEYFDSLRKDGLEVFTRKLQKNSTEEIKREKEKILATLDLCIPCKPIVKQNCFECIGSVKKREKGIDVKIASDMIRKVLIEEDCDVCVLISGDADFIPAMEIIKDAGKEAVTSSLIQGYSRELMDGKFRYFIIRRKEFIANCLKNYSEVKKA